MIFLVYFAQTRHIDMGVDLRCRDALMSKHFLYLAQVGAVLKHVRRETMSQRVRADICGRPDTNRVFFNKFPKRFSS